MCDPIRIRNKLNKTGKIIQTYNKKVKVHNQGSGNEEKPSSFMTLLTTSSNVNVDVNVG